MADERRGHRYRARWLSALLLLAVAMPRTYAQLDSTAEALDDIELTTARCLFDPTPNQSWVAMRIAVKNDGPRARAMTLLVTTLVNGAPLADVRYPVVAGAGDRKTTRGIVSAYVGGQSNVEIRARLVAAGNEAMTFDPVAVGGERWVRTVPIPRRELYDSESIVARMRAFAGSKPVFPYRTINVLFLVPASKLSIQPQIESAYTFALKRVAETRSVHSQTLTVAELPKRPEAYECVDRFVICGLDRSAVDAEAAFAIEQSVRSGRIAWIVPGFDGEGNDWVLPREDAQFANETIGDDKWGVFHYANDPGIERLTSPPGMLREYRAGLGSFRRLVGLGGRTFPFQADLSWSWHNELTSVADNPVATDNSDEALPTTLDWVRLVDDHHRDDVDTSVVFALIAIYLLVVGPLLDWWLRRRNRLVWSLWLQPLVVAIFLGITWSLGALRFGSTERRFETLVVYQPEAESAAYGISVLTRYNPEKGNAVIAARNGGFPYFLAIGRNRPLVHWRLPELSGIAPPQLVDLPFGKWSYSDFLSSGPIELGGSVVIDRFQSQDASGDQVREGLRVTNHMPFPISDPFFMIDDRACHFRVAIAPGATNELFSDSAISDVGYHGQLEHTLYKGMSASIAVFRFDRSELTNDIEIAIDGDFARRDGYLCVLRDDR